MTRKYAASTRQIREIEKQADLSIDGLKDAIEQIDRGELKAKTAKDELVRSNLRLVVSLAKKVYQPGPSVSGPYSGRQYRPYQGRGKIRISAGL